MNEVTEILTNEDALETVEEIVKAIPSNGFGKGVAIGVGGVLVGELVYKYALKPLGHKIKTWAENRKAETADEADEAVEVTYEEVE